MNAGVRSQTKVTIIVSSIITIGLIFFLAINANRNLERMNQNNSDLYSAYRISELMRTFRTNLIALENKHRGYLVTGDARFLEEYKIRESEIKTGLKNMEKYFSDRPEEPLFNELKEITYNKIVQAKSLGTKQSLEGYNQSDSESSAGSIIEFQPTIDRINESLAKETNILIQKSVELVSESNLWSILEILAGALVALAASIIVIRDLNIRSRLEAELRAAKTLAEENAILKEQFMANMSHEIRTPMNAILGFTDLLRKTKLDLEQADYLSAVSTSSTNLLNIVNDILDFSKIEAGKLRIEKITFEVGVVLDSIKVIFEQKALDKGIFFKATVDERIPKLLFGDPTRLSQILVNLVNNAIKFTSEGSVTLNCDLISIEHENAVLKFRIKDTGIGIPETKLSDVFERFNQGNKETTRLYGGTGLGLAIVSNLITLQDGTIEVKSKEGVGSEFTVTLGYPVSYDENYSGKTVVTENLSQLSNGQKLILLAEDNEFNQKLACKYLESWGLKVEIAENGVSAVEKVKSMKFDLVLMDIQMPLRDGYQASQIIREELRSAVPIVAMTAHIMEGEREKCLKYGMNDYITKPFRENALHSIVAKHLKADNKTQADKAAKNAPHSQASALDLEDLYNVSRGDVNFLREMIELFLEKNPLDIQVLENAITAEDFETMRGISHRMKTSLGFMGLRSQLSFLDEIELLSEKDEGLDQIKIQFNKVKANCETARTMLQKELSNFMQKQK